MATIRVDSEVTRIMMGVNESSIKGYPHASISSKSAFEWTLNKIIRSNTSGFKLLFLHVQVPDEDGVNFESDEEYGFDDIDSIYASPEDFRDLNRKDKINGSHLLEVFVGTVSEFCVKHCECPVVTIKRSADETPQDPVDD
ncbi:hypothetical protein Ccrd_005167 [Cynara cardunculus var. scolymus]|uniref:UspA domain-containing protein n=1 Tax=Cynara cardunculus var. scolymus TaxID=59895 RepID=A0A103XLR1_CYNCS|nr:hypothetical protein Ccrd_005167 [Cynara cardunculus var. scolymus]